MTSPRHQAREAALQVLYFWEVGRDAPGEALETFFAEHEPDAPRGRARRSPRELVLGTIGRGRRARRAHRSSTRQHWRVERLAVIDRLILRMAVVGAAARSRTRRRPVVIERGPRAGADVQHATTPCGSSTACSTRSAKTLASVDETSMLCRTKPNRSRSARPSSTSWSRLGVAPYPQPVRSHRHRSARSSPTHGGKTGEALEAERPVVRAAGRILGIRGVRQGQLPRAVGRARARCRSTCAPIRCRALDFQIYQAARLRRSHRRRRARVPDEDERADDLGVAHRRFSPSACCRCPRSGTA